MSEWDKFPKADQADPWAAFPASGNFIDTWQTERPDLLGVVHGPAIDQGAMLPFSKDAQGRTFLDFDAGLIGAIKSGITLPGDVASGKVDPNSQEAMDRAWDFTGIAAPVNPAIRAGERAIPGVLKSLRPSKLKAPTVDALKESAEAGYEAIRAMGVDYSSSAVKSLADDIQRELTEKGILAELAPKTYSVLGKLQSPPAESVASIEGLVAARRALNNAAGDFTNPTERLAANRIIDRLDEFLLGPDEASVVARAGVGDGGEASAFTRASAAGKILEDSRGDYAAAKRSEKITGAEERAELNAAVANSGANVDNQLRARAAELLKKPKETRGFSKEELALIRRIAEGTFTTNFTRRLGNLLGGGGGLGAQVTGGLGMAAGGALGGFPAAGVGYFLPPLVGAASKKASAALVGKQYEKLDEAVRKRSPLYEQMLKSKPMEAADPTTRAAIARALMLIYGSPEQLPQQ